MTYSVIGKPAPDEYAPYYSRYINLVPESDIIHALNQQLHSTLSLLNGIPESKSDTRYAPGKWSIKELLGHVIDTERIFAYRALRFARNDRTPLPGYEQDDYVRHSTFGDSQLGELAAEFEYVRRSNLYFFKHLDSSAWLRSGIANDNEISVRALAYVIAGHELHHMGIVSTRYL